MKKYKYYKDYYCYLCKSSKIRFVSVENKLKNIFHIVRCKSCGLIQTVENALPNSRVYINLTLSDIDKNIIWCQGDHKLPAFY